MPGEIFSQVYGHIYLDIFREFEKEHVDFALAMQEENRKEIAYKKSLRKRSGQIKIFERKFSKCVGWKKIGFS